MHNIIISKYRDCLFVDDGRTKLSLVHLAWPMVLENIMKYLITTVNTLTMSSYSDHAVAAVGVSGQVVNLINSVYVAVGVGIMVVVSQHLGAGKTEKASQISSVSIGLMALFSMVFMAVIFLFCDPILKIMQLDDSLMKDGRDYLLIVSFFTLFDGLIAAVSSLEKSYGHIRVPMVVMIVMNALNALGSYIVIFRPFEVPVHGVAGVAIARGISTVISFLLLVVLSRKTSLCFSLSAFARKNAPLKNMRTILKIGIPTGLSSISYQLSQTVATAIMAEVGVAAVASMVYVGNIVQYIKAFSLSVSYAYEIMIGRLIGMGEKKQAFEMGKFCITLCASVNTLFAVLIVLFRFPLLGLFTDAEDILHMAGAVMMIDIVVELFRAMNHGGGGCLTAVGDTRYFMKVAILSCWIFSIGLSWLLGIGLHMGIYGCWLAFCVDEGFRAVSYFRRWKSREWMQINVI